MKNLITLILITTVLMSCTSSVDNSKKNIALVENYITAVENLDSEGMDNFLSDDYIGYGPNYGASINKEEVLKNWKDYSNTLYKSIDYKKSKNIAVSITEGDNIGDWVANWAELTIVYLRDDAEVTIYANTTYQIKDGKIIKSYTIYNEADVLNQLGYLFIKNN